MRFRRNRFFRGWAAALTLLLLVVTLAAAVEAGDGRSLVYVGTYTGKGSEGIYLFRFDPATGDLGPTGLAARTDNPSFLAVDSRARFLYAVNELDTFMNEPTGAVSCFSVDGASGDLTFLQQVSSRGQGPAHLSLDRTGRFLLVANYGGGSVAVYPIEEDGKLGRSTGFVQAAGSSINPDRQAGPHAHAIQVTSDNRFALVADLGLDKLLVYPFNARTGALKADSLRSCALDPGAGPRHVAIAPSGKFVYVVNELSSTVTAFAYDPEKGLLHRVQTLSTRPERAAGKNTTAEILVDAAGKFVYVSNRGDDSIVVFGIDSEKGTLKALQWISSGGKSPRNIALDPTGRWLFAANQRSDSIVLFHVDPLSGQLTPASRSVKLVSPVCISLVPGKP